MAALSIERRIERLEKELRMTDERLIVRIRQLSDHGGDGEVTQFRCGERFYDREPGETERAFEERTEREVFANCEHIEPCIVIIETQHRLPTLRIPVKKGEQHGRV